MMKKRLGQHFLISRSIANRIVQFAAVESSDAVLEIGPGRGALTDELIETGARVAAVELDEYLCRLLNKKYSARNNITVLNEDILAVSLEEIAGQYFSSCNKMKILGNIAFNISSPLLEQLVQQHQSFELAVLMFQKEFADRLCAEPGTASYGKLSVMAELYFERIFGFKVKSSMFYPPPKVDGCVIKLIPRKTFAIPIAENELHAFREFLNYCFAYKRKTLLNSLCESFEKSSAAPPLKNRLTDAFSKAHLSPGVRAEQMNIEQFWKLFGIMKDM